MKSTHKYLLRRLIIYFITLWFALTLNFIIPRLSEANPIQMQLTRMVSLGENILYETFNATEAVATLKSKLGLDKDLFTQYVLYLKNMFMFDFGISYMAFPTPVRELIMLYLPYTIGLLFTTTIISWILGVLIGVFTGFRRGRVDSFLTSAMLFLSRIPFYILSVILIYFFAFLFPIFPKSGTYGLWLTPKLDFQFISSLIYHSTLPALSILLVSLGGWMIMTRSTVVNLLEEDYLTLATAKGLKKSQIIKRYILRNALLPQVTALGIVLGNTLSGSLIVEIVFSYRGIGMLITRAVSEGDIFVVQAVFFLITFVILTANLIIDLIYPLIDPRIKVG